MPSLLVAFLQILPVFFLIALGGALRRVRFLREETLPPLNRIVFYVLAPPLMFLSVAETDLHAALEPRLVAVTLFGVLLFSVAVFLVPGSRLPPAEQGVLTQGAARSNLIFVGLAVLLNLHGEAILPRAAVFISFHAVLINVLCVLFLILPHGSLRERAGVRLAAGQVLLNPIVLGCLCGMAFSLTGRPIPAPLRAPLEELAGAALPLALLLTGASLRGSRMRDRLGTVALATVLKLVALPGWTLLLVWLAGASGPSALLSVVLLGSPTAAMSQVMARELQGDEELAASIVVATTLLSPLTLTCWIGLLQ